MASPSTARLARQLRFALRPHCLQAQRLPSRTPRRAFTKPSAPRHSIDSSNVVGHFAPRAAALLASLGLLSLALYHSLAPHSFLDAASAPLSFAESAPDVARDGRDARLPRFRISEVRKHDAKSDHPWVVHGDKVYDITDWIAAHPGGQVILRAAGGSVEPYWSIFAIHKSQYVYDILEQYLIGYVHADDLVNGKPAQESIEDPFSQDPQRDPRLITLTPKPRNAETPAEALAASFITPNELFYVRNHMWVPSMTDEEAEAHVLTVELLDGTTKEYTLRDLKTNFPKRSVTAVLQCSGNRRSHMSRDAGRAANGLPWAAGAISNATWEGVRLADVLADAGFDTSSALDGTSEEKHVHFAGLEAYAASIPMKKAVDPQGDVLLAYGMNGKPLPRDHGFPLRSVVPGNVAARSVKWLSHVTLSDEESGSQWQRRDYKCFGPNQTKVDWDTAPSIQEMPVQSAVTAVKLEGWKADGTARGVAMSGYAISGGGREIIRVDVSVDGGKSWAQAKLLPDRVSEDARAWAWKRWRFDGDIPSGAFMDGKGCTTVLVKATDEVYNTQPERQASIWNVRGNLATAWHRVQVCSDCSPTSATTSRSEE